MKIKSLAISLVLGLLLAIFPLRVVAHASTWSGSGWGIVALSDGTTSYPQLQYDIWMWFGTWDFYTIAKADGEIELSYLYQGSHSWFQVTVFIEAYVIHNGVTTVIPLVNLGPVNCCVYPSGGFYESGSVTLNVQAGDTYGFQFGGSNRDWYERLLGTFTILPTKVNIDIKPGSYPNSFNNDGNGVIPVAILTTDTFDAANVNPFTLSLDGAHTRVKGKSGSAGSLEDVDGDGDLDLIVQIEDIAGTYQAGDDVATLSGQTYDGDWIIGSDSIRIEP